MLELRETTKCRAVSHLGGACEAQAVITQPVHLCDTHRLRVALDVLPEVIGRAMGANPLETPALHPSSASPSDLVGAAQPALFPVGLEGKHDPVVYFMLNGGRVKIGFSTALASRLRALAMQPEAILVLLKGGRRLEAALHDRFSAHRIGQTEWFEPASELLRYVGTRLARPAVSVQPQRALPRPAVPAVRSAPRATPARKALREVLAEERVAGANSIGPGHVSSRYGESISRSRAWISIEMSRLADEGFLIRTEDAGVYCFALNGGSS
ncbi:GIY-YIG nuclease family protein [Streptomyces sp. NPDC057552]|uniref:GIY-YIG nuclease family protein n=1 Tax=Streptomyces sp. NPDC057552 TaxID=3350537 RepID=UPI0036B369A4